MARAAPPTPTLFQPLPPPTPPPQPYQYNHHHHSRLHPSLAQASAPPSAPPQSGWTSCSRQRRIGTWRTSVPSTSW
eukprot:scaffold78838_cov58-Phaeocystis_antarctica.AAC.3